MNQSNILLWCTLAQIERSFNHYDEVQIRLCKIIYIYINIIQHILFKFNY